MAMAYCLAKWAAYCGWCAVAIRRLAPARAVGWRGAVRWGSVRLLLGFVLGLVIFVSAYKVNAWSESAAFTYLVTYVPVRIFEWGLILHLMGTRGTPMPRRIAWLVGGIALSCFVDMGYCWIFDDTLIPAGRVICQWCRACAGYWLA